MSASPLVGAAAVCGAVVSMYWTVAGDRRSTRRAARNLRRGLGPTTDMREHLLAEPASERVVVPLVARIGALVRRVSPVGAVENLNRRIVKAGMTATWPLDRVLAMKLLFGLVGMVVGVSLLGVGNAIMTFYGLITPPLFFFGPDLILRVKGKERQRRIRIDLADTLDQVTVCVEAGLAFEGALARSAKTGEGPLAEEIVRTLQDVQLGVPRRDAMLGLADRNEVDELRQFVLAINQAEGYGVPIARVLRVQANELREKRRQEAEERAMKVSIKMLFPLVTCILPTTFIVMVGPVIFQLVDTLGGGVG
jgi:tight adherence protein C